MKKRTIILLVIALIAVAGLYFGVRAINQNAEEAKESKEEAATAISIDANTVHHMTYGFDGDTWSFTKSEDNRWHYDGDPEYPLSQVYIPSMVSGLCQLKYDKLITEDCEDMSEYGLDKVAYWCSVKQDDGTVTTIFIGARNDVTGMYYLNIDGTNAVYTVDPAFVNRFAYTLAGMTIMEEIPMISESMVTQIDVETPVYAYSFYHVTSGMEAYDYTGNCTWFIKDDEAGYAPVDPTITSDWFRYLADPQLFYYNKCVDYTDDAEKLAEYGLDDPRYTLTIHYREMVEKETGRVDANGAPITESQVLDREYKLHIGDGTPFDGTESNETVESTEETEAESLNMDMIGADIPTLGDDEELPIESESAEETEETEPEEVPEGIELYQGFYYAQVDGSKQVYRMEAALINEFIRFSQADAVNKDFNNIPISEIASIEVETKDGTALVEIDRSEDADGKVTRSFRLNGAEMSEEDFNTFFGALTAVKGTKSIPGEAVSAAPEMKVTYHLNNHYFETVTVEYIKYNINYYQANINGRPLKIINKKVVVKAVNALAAFMQ